MRDLSYAELNREDIQLLPTREALALVDLSDLVTIDLTTIMGFDIATALNVLSPEANAEADIDQYLRG